MSSQSCDICGAPDIKYKCPSCKSPRYVQQCYSTNPRADARSCSLPCFKQHKAACSALPPQTTLSTTSEDLTQSNTHPQQPTQLPVPSASDLRTLFARYPSLRFQLRQIYQSTQEPSETPNAGPAEHNGRPFLSRTWKPERGFQSGLKSLQAALSCDGGDAEGITAFMKLLSSEPHSEI